MYCDNAAAGNTYNVTHREFARRRSLAALCRVTAEQRQSLVPRLRLLPALPRRLRQLPGAQLRLQPVPVLAGPFPDQLGFVQPQLGRQANPGLVENATFLIESEQAAFCAQKVAVRLVPDAPHKAGQQS